MATTTTTTTRIPYQQQTQQTQHQQQQSNTTVTKPTTTIQSLIQNFLASTLVCMFNSKTNDSSFSVFRQSCEILCLDAGDIGRFRQVCERVDKTVSRLETNKWSEFMLWNIEKFKIVWLQYFPNYTVQIGRAIDEIREKIQAQNNETYWQTLDSSYIWNWLHIVSIDIDLNAGMIAKIGFLTFIKDLISCGLCLGHYRQHLAEIIRSLETTTCYNTLLALHTYINAHRDDASSTSNNNKQYMYNSDFVNLFFYRKYKREYLMLKTSCEQ